MLRNKHKDIRLKVGTTKRINNKLYRLNKNHRWECCPGGKIRSRGRGMGLGVGKGRGPIGRMK